MGVVDVVLLCDIVLLFDRELVSAGEVCSSRMRPGDWGLGRQVGLHDLRTGTGGRGEEGEMGERSIVFSLSAVNEHSTWPRGTGLFNVRRVT